MNLDSVIITELSDNDNVEPSPEDDDNYESLLEAIRQLPADSPRPQSRFSPSDSIQRRSVGLFDGPEDYYTMYEDDILEPPNELEQLINHVDAMDTVMRSMQRGQIRIGEQCDKINDQLSRMDMQLNAIETTLNELLNGL